MAAKHVTVTVPCNQGRRGCDHQFAVAAESISRDEVDGGYEWRLHISAEADADLRAQFLAHLADHACLHFHTSEHH